MNHDPFGFPFKTGVIARLKAINPDFLATHCMLHCHHYSLTSWRWQLHLLKNEAIERKNETRRHKHSSAAHGFLSHEQLACGCTERCGHLSPYSTEPARLWFEHWPEKLEKPWSNTTGSKKLAGDLYCMSHCLLQCFLSISLASPYQIIVKKKKKN